MMEIVEEEEKEEEEIQRYRYDLIPPYPLSDPQKSAGERNVTSQGFLIRRT